MMRTPFSVLSAIAALAVSAMPGHAMTRALPLSMPASRPTAHRGRGIAAAKIKRAAKKARAVRREKARQRRRS